MSRRVCLLSCLCCALVAGDVLAAGAVRRLAVVAGANYGSSDRAPLKYAVSDAEGFASVLVSLGGVDADDCILLRQPSLADLERAFNEVRDKAASRSVPGEPKPGRTEVLFYYSGHADEAGLLLGEDRYSYRTFRERMSSIPADVRIAVLDACASGAITRLKGGKRRKAFLVDESSDMRGHAFLTSSSSDEVAQESDSVGGSFFTHYLVSGLRGAADVSGEGKVTLNEAYQFAFHETLGRTAETRGGAQHPAWDISLTGTGDVVMTDVRQISAGLVLDEDLRGRFFVRNAEQQLVVELFKSQGRSVELGLEPGSYEVRCERESGAWLSKARLSDGHRVALTPEDFEPTTREQTAFRGGRHFEPEFGALERRSRLELGFGYRAGGTRDRSGQGGVVVSAGAEDFWVSFGYSRWVQERLAVTLSFNALSGGTTEAIQAGSVTTSAGGLTSVQVGIRAYLGRSNPRLFLTASGGPYIWGGTTTITSPAGVVEDVGAEAAFGGTVGGGLDVQLGRSWMLGVSAGYNYVSDFSRPVAGKENHSGFQMGVSFSWLFGKGGPPQ